MIMMQLYVPRPRLKFVVGGLDDDTKVNICVRLLNCLMFDLIRGENIIKQAQTTHPPFRSSDNIVCASNVFQAR